MATRKVLGKRLSAGHTVECVHGSQGNFITARILQHVLEDVGHGSGVGVIRPTARVRRRHCDEGDMMSAQGEVNVQDLRRFVLAMWKQRGKAWGANAVEKGMFSLPW